MSAQTKKTDSEAAQIVAEIADGVLNEKPCRISRIYSGVVNAVFDVEVPAQQVIFRVQFDNDDRERFLKEKWCLARAQALGIPSPDVIAIGLHQTHSYAIHSKVPGVVGSAFRGDLAELWCTLGRYAKLFNAIATYGFGEGLYQPEDGSAAVPLQVWVDTYLCYIFADTSIVEHKIVSPADFDRSRLILEEMRGWQGEPRLCHGNLALKNVIVNEDGTVYLLDWGTARGHLAPQLDLAELLVWALPESSLMAFYHGYGLTAGEVGRLQREVLRLQLWRILEAAKWSIIQCRPKEHYVDICRQIFTRILNQIGANPSQG